MAEQFALAEAVINVKAQDNASRVVDQSMKKSQQSVQTGAQVIRNSVNSVTRGLGTSIGPAITPLVGIGEAFTLMAERAETGGGRVMAALQGVGAAGLAIGAELTILNANEKQAQDQLSNAIANTGGSYDQYKVKIEEVIKTQENYGHSAIQTDQALNTLVNATHDTAQATNLMSEAADLSAARHISLTNASAQLARAIGGSGRIFKQFGIQQEYTAAGTLNLTAMNEKLAKILNGQAAAAADNWGGRLRKWGVQIEDTMAKLGKFGPEIMAASAVLLLYSTVVQATSAKNAASMAKEALAKEEAVAAEIKANEAAAVAEAEAALQVQIAQEKKVAAYAIAAEAIQKYQLAIAVGDTEQVVAMEATYGGMEEIQLAFATGDQELTAKVVAEAEVRTAAREAEAAAAAAAGAETAAAGRLSGAGSLSSGLFATLAKGAPIIAAVGLGISTLTQIMSENKSSTKELTSATESYTAALAQTGDVGKVAINAAIDQQAAQAKLGDAYTNNKKAIQTYVESSSQNLGDLNALISKVLPKDASKSTIDNFIHFLTVQSAAFKTASSKADELSTATVKIDMTSQATTDTLSTFAGQLGINDKQAQTYLGTLGIVADKSGNFAQSNHEVQQSLDAVTHQYNTANEAQKGYLDGLDKFAKTGGDAQDRASLIGSTLVAANGDALGFTAALASTTKAVLTMTDSFKSQADAISKGNLLYRDSERAALKFTGTGKAMTATINSSAAGASDLVGQLQGMQDAAMKAAEAEYQHNVQTEGGKKAADDAYNIYVTKTQQQLIDNAKKLGLNKTQAEALAKQYFGMPTDVKSKIEQEGAESVTSILERIELDMRAITEHKTVAQIVAEDHATGTMNALETQIYNLTHQPHVITVTTKIGGTGPLAGKPMPQATGGLINGPGGPTDDEAGVFALSDQEYVVSAKGTSGNEEALNMANTGAYKLVAVKKMAKGGKAVTGWQPGDPYPTQYVPGTSKSTTKKKKVSYTDANLIWKIDTSDFVKEMADIQGATKTLATATQTMINDVRKASQLGIGPSSLVAVLQREDTTLLAESTKRNAIAAKLKIANTNLVAEQKLYNDEIINAQKQITGNFDLSNVGAGSTGGSFSNLIAGMQQQVKDTQRFATELKTLNAEGLNKDLYAELLAGGPNSANAKVLANASKSQIGQINSLYSQIATSAHTGAISAADEMYGAGVKAAQGIVSGLKSQEAALDKQMTKLADVMVNQIKKDLKIHSPSEVGHDIGHMFGQGIGLGLDRNISTLQRKAGALSGAMVNGASGGAAYSGGGISIDRFVLQVQQLDDVNHLLNIIHGLPQAIRAGAG